MIRPYYTLPDIPDAGLLQQYLETLAVIVPIGRTNLCTNPSVETADTWVSRGTITTGGRTTDESYFGIYSYFCTPDTANTTNARFGGVGWGSVVPIASTTYAVSVHVLGAIGVPYRLYVEDSTGPVTVTQAAFVGTGHWQWVSLVYTEGGAPTGSRNYIISKNDSRDGSTYYVDGLQVEICAAGEWFPTTYIDGDQPGLVPNQAPPAYGWNGAAHASTSYRSGQTRAGGRVVRFKNFGLLLSALIGLGLAPPQHEALTFAQLDGGQYQNTIKPPRSFSLTGRWTAPNPTVLESDIGQLARLLDRDRIAQRQPLVLAAQANDGDEVRIEAVYSGGLEGQAVNLPTAAGQITFTQYIPYITTHRQGAALTVQRTVTGTDYLVQRAPDGTWSAIAGLNGTVNALAIGPEGYLYVGGAFTNAGGNASADFIAYWDGTSWHNLGTGGNSTVNAIVFDAAGNLYAGGNFTLMGGVANTAGIAKWNPLTLTWSALSTGLTGGVSPACYALVIDRSGNLYAGGAFTDAGGSGADNLAKWNGSAWATVGGATAINSTVTALVVDAANNLYAGGSFTDAGGMTDADRVAKWNGSAWSDLRAGTNNNVSALAIGVNGIIYAGGAFTVAGGVTVGYIAQWNGVTWATMGTAMNNSVSSLDIGLSGILYAGGTFTTVNGVTYADAAAMWNGYTWLPLGINLPGTPTLTAVLERSDGTVYLGYSTSGNSVAAGITTATNDSTVGVYPTLTIYGPSSGTSRIYHLINTTTGTAIYFNLTMSPGEVVTLTLNPTNITFVSSAQGNVLNTVMPGSELSSFVLQPGANTISLYAASSTVTATLQWDISYGSLGDAIAQQTL